MEATQMPIDRWMDKDVGLLLIYVYTIECCSAIKKEWNNAVCSNMDGHGGYHKWSKSARERQISYDINYMQNLKKNWYKWTYLQKRNKFMDFENKLIVTKG